MGTPISYFQTLANDEATAFVTSLQRVKAHLSQELQGLEAQVQQKMLQLQGIETLLLEALGLGLTTAATHITPEETATVAVPIRHVEAPTITTDESALTLSATADGNTLPMAETQPATTAIAALSNEEPSKQSRGQHGKAVADKTPRSAKASATTKPSNTKAKQPASSRLPARKANQRGKASNLQPFLKAQFRDQALTEAVGEILSRASAPLSTDEVMAALYDGLPQVAYDRAKHSLANTLSVGRSKGSWQSTGRGRYASNAVTTD